MASQLAFNSMLFILSIYTLPCIMWFSAIPFAVGAPIINVDSLYSPPITFNTDNTSSLGHQSSSTGTQINREDWGSIAAIIIVLLSAILILVVAIGLAGPFGTLVGRVLGRCYPNLKPTTTASPSNNDDMLAKIVELTRQCTEKDIKIAYAEGHAHQREAVLNGEKLVICKGLFASVAKEAANKIIQEQYEAQLRELRERDVRDRLRLVAEITAYTATRRMPARTSLEDKTFSGDHLSQAANDKQVLFEERGDIIITLEQEVKNAQSTAEIILGENDALLSHISQRDTEIARLRAALLAEQAKVQYLEVRKGQDAAAIEALKGKIGIMYSDLSIASADAEIFREIAEELRDENDKLKARKVFGYASPPMMAEDEVIDASEMALLGIERNEFTRALSSSTVVSSGPFYSSAKSLSSAQSLSSSGTFAASGSVSFILSSPRVFTFSYRATSPFKTPAMRRHCKPMSIDVASLASFLSAGEDSLDAALQMVRSESMAIEEISLCDFPDTTPAMPAQCRDMLIDLDSPASTSSEDSLDAAPQMARAQSMAIDDSEVSFCGSSIRDGSLPVGLYNSPEFVAQMRPSTSLLLDDDLSPAAKSDVLTSPKSTTCDDSWYHESPSLSIVLAELPAPAIFPVSSSSSFTSLGALFRPSGYSSLPVNAKSGKQHAPPKDFLDLFSPSFAHGPVGFRTEPGFIDYLTVPSASCLVPPVHIHPHPLAAYTSTPKTPSRRYGVQAGNA